MTAPLPIILDIATLAIGLFLILWEAFDDQKQKSAAGWIAIGGIAAVLATSFFAQPLLLDPNTQLARFYSADAFAIFYKQIALGATLFVLIMAMEYRPLLAKYIPGANPEAGTAEFFALPVLTCAGLMWMASAVDFIFIFVALELVTISFYILVSYMRRHVGSLEAGVKYLILGALSTGFLVYGITWIFGVTGQTNLSVLARIIPSLPESSLVPLLFGMTLVLVGLGFKIAAVPFQMWVPDVYQGAPTPITAFLSVGSKAAGFIILMRVAQPFLGHSEIAPKLLGAFSAMALLTLLFGNLAAMPQDNLKRLLAYSSIGHAGYLLMALACAGVVATVPITVTYYLAAYLPMTLLAFLVMIVVNRATGGDALTNFNGLGQRSPVLAFGMLMAMLSLAGVPFTAGFMGKLLVFKDAIEAQQWLLLVVAIITVGAGFYYYLKVVRAMYWKAPSETTPIPVSPLTRTAIGVLIALIFILGVYPQPVLDKLNTRPRAEGQPDTPVSQNVTLPPAPAAPLALNP